jgi:hypothetical protein
LSRDLGQRGERARSNSESSWQRGDQRRQSRRQLGRGGFDRSFGEYGPEGRGAARDAASTEPSAQAFQSATDPHFGGVFADAEERAQLPHGSSFKEAEQNGLAFRVVQFVERFIQYCGQVVPTWMAGVRRLRLRLKLHSDRFFLPKTPAGLRTPEIDGRTNGGAMKPGDQLTVVVKLWSRLGQAYEDELSDILRQGKIGDPPFYHRIDEVRVTADEFAERLFVPVSAEDCQQSGSIHSTRRTSLCGKR